MSDGVPDPTLVGMLKLDIDLRRTCKRIQKVVDYFIKSNYPAVKIGYGELTIWPNQFEVFERYDSVKIKMIKKLQISTEVWNRKGVRDTTKHETFKMLLSQIEELECDVDNGFVSDFYDSVLKWCSNLKRLSILEVQSNRFIGDDNQWLLRSALKF